jgi:hypothetical protein
VKDKEWEAGHEPRTIQAQSPIGSDQICIGLFRVEFLAGSGQVGPRRTIRNPSATKGHHELARNSNTEKSDQV